MGLAWPRSFDAAEALKEVPSQPQQPSWLTVQEPELTVLMPCLNEVRTLPACITKARQYFQSAGIRGEILIADNGSNDGSQELARSLGARVVDVPRRGYGAALIAGIEASQGRFVIMGDSDDSYDFSRLDAFVRELRAGAQLVMGNRFAGGIEPGAMPPLHRYLGNPVLSFLGRGFVGVGVRDFHCGLRGFDRQAMLGLGLHCEGMEFASEMVVKAALAELRIVEVPTTLSPDGRDRPPHLRSWRDGWRHLRFLLLFSPRWLFFYPGILITALMIAQLAYCQLHLQHQTSWPVGIHTQLVASGMLLIGIQTILFAIGVSLARSLAGLQIKERHDLATIHMQRGPLLAVLGSISSLTGLSICAAKAIAWANAGFVTLDPEVTMRQIIPGVTLMLGGVQVLLSSMFFAALKSASDWQHAPSLRRDKLTTKAD